MRANRPPALVLLLWLGYAGLVGYVSLTPFGPWRSAAELDAGFLLAPWPRYVTAVDVCINVLAYLPLGWLAACLLLTRSRPVTAVCLATLLGALFSLGMELLQSLLPSRIPSNLDILSNGSGALLGALPWLWPRHAERCLQPLERWRRRVLLPGATAELGVCLLLLWSACHLNPSIPFLGAGVLHNPYVEAAAEPAAASGDWVLLALAAALTVSGLGSFLASLLRQPARAPAITLFWLVGVMAVKATMAEFLLRPLLSTAWFGSATLTGLSLGAFLLIATRRLPPAAQVLLSGACLLAGGVLAKLGSHYIPFSALRALFGWNFTQLRSFAGLTVWLNEIWPLFALLYLALWWPRRCAPQLRYHQRP